jgi:hypothetical protein
MIVNYYPGGSVDKIGTPLRYTGSFFVKIDENNQDNWECHLLTSGTLTTEKSVDVDIFLVGGGGGGGGGVTYQYIGGGGGGSGYTFSTTDETNAVTLHRGTQYSAVIGAGGTPGTNANGGSSMRAEGTPGGSGGSTTFSALVTGGFSYSASGGQGGGGGVKPASDTGVPSGGGGGSGERVGGKGCYYEPGSEVSTHHVAGRGSPNVKYATYEPIVEELVYYFHEEGQDCCAGGGAGGCGYGSSAAYAGIAYGGIGGGGASGQSGVPYTGSGGGGGGGYVGGVGMNLSPGAGASGVIIIRNHRSAT